MRGRRPITIPGGTVKWVPPTCSTQFSDPLATALIKLLSDSWFLPECVLISSAMVTVTKSTVYVPVVNVGETDVLLHPRRPIGLLSQAQVVSFPEWVSIVEQVSGLTATLSA